MYRLGVDGLADFLGHGVCLLGVGVRQHAHKLLASPMSQGVAGTQAVASNVGDGLKHRVALAVAKTKVHQLEAVDIEKDECKGILGCRTGGQGMLYQGMGRRTADDAVQARALGQGGV